MLYVIQNGFNGVKTNNPENIIYCVTSVQKIVDLGVDFIFTDGHAIDRLSSQYSNVDIVNIDNFVDISTGCSIFRQRLHLVTK